MESPVATYPEAHRWAAADWKQRQAEHEARVGAWTRPHQERAARGEKHPVYDFLFEYYSYRPSWLRRWHPGVGVELGGPGAETFLENPAYSKGEYGVRIDREKVPARRLQTVQWVAELLRGMTIRPPLFGCFGLHEWAMVYRAKPDEVRHSQTPLRLSLEEIAAVVERHALCCTHYDAFRFFTAEARPLNRQTLERPDIPRLEQRGCLHANMDLYKWAYKLAPYTSAELIADCFALARDIREVDMRASPYDFSSLGFLPIEIETPAGKQAYETAQRSFAARGEPLRARLLAVCEQMLGSSN